MVTKRLFHSIGRLRTVKKPQFNVKYMISKLDEFSDSIQARELVDGEELQISLKMLPELYQKSRVADHTIANLQHSRKTIEAQVKQDKTRARELGSELKSLKKQYQDLLKTQREVKDQITEVCGSLPNLIHPSVPKTSSPIIDQWINKQAQYKPDERFEHLKIMVNKGMVDFETASNVTGTSWYYLCNDGARLEHALVQYATTKARKANFNLVIPPSVVRNEVIDACGFRPRDTNNEQQIYRLSDTDLGLTATAEIALAGMGLDSILDLSSGPKKICGVNRAYRAEAGASGKDTKGLYRVHEFTKVELFVWAKPEQSDQILEELKQFQIDIVRELGLSAQVLNMPSNDLGSPAYKKYDIEAWMPGRGSFGEITSTSNCTDFQSRRMHTRFRNEEGELEYAHTLNGTAMAVPRVIVALVENNYDPVSDTISIPQALQPYLDGMEFM
ncbi:putative serine--tRNA ligase DIA4 [Kluyveromyces lactis]|uniref:serine--tRNA ligase n=1 Tax=Kluyveromyces lactis (strain ATCC 8585 / CBS 2359 / DSM 70799 / NBRC 1267 / NRRL Y-1140 / WM37) TaxID=284590 RepID=Q6CPP0_KLULA|nr:uncharacterized protein KLLA0_E03433g [Kluyveromyces lactis]CAG99186.1 KLLA0E03433p [Kluyveromyces lactis]|eukprot:XP_454099.1 uncharacterized protein KLLA0_E03433g [Kluyveromyces lactis]